MAGCEDIYRNRAIRHCCGSLIFATHLFEISKGCILEIKHLTLRSIIKENSYLVAFHQQTTKRNNIYYFSLIVRIFSF